MAHIDSLTLVSAAQIADTDNLYVGRPGDIDPDRRTLVSSLLAKILADPSGVPFYEEGTWTPNLIATTTQPTITYSAQTGYYVAIGNLITINYYVATTVRTGGSGNVRIDGLPYDAAPNATHAFPGGAVRAENISFPTGQIMATMTTGVGTTTIEPRRNVDASSSVAVPIGNWATGATTSLRGTMTYFAQRGVW